MHKIDGANHVSGQFSPGDPTADPVVFPTQVTADILNALQEEICTWLEGEGVTLDDADHRQLLAAIRALEGNYLGQRNLLINGDFSIWQRATAKVLTSGQYLPDRFFCDVGDGTATIQRLASADEVSALTDWGAGSIPVYPAYLLDWNQTAGSTTRPFLYQRLEDPMTLSGRDLVGSINLQSLSGTAEADLELRIDYGSGGSAPQTFADAVTVEAGASWSRNHFPITVPDLSGKTFGDGAFIEARLLLDAGGGAFQWRMSEFQLEVASGDPTPFERRHRALELLQAMRYFETSYAQDVAPGTTAQQSSAVMGYHDYGVGGLTFETLLRRFRVPKRVTPTIIWYSPDTGAAGQLHFDGVNRTVSATTDTSTEATGYPEVGSLGGAGSAFARVHFAADAEL